MQSSMLAMVQIFCANTRAEGTYIHKPQTTCLLVPSDYSLCNVASDVSNDDDEVLACEYFSQFA